MFKINLLNNPGLQIKDNVETLNFVPENAGPTSMNLGQPLEITPKQRVASSPASTTPPKVVPWARLLGIAISVLILIGALFIIRGWVSGNSMFTDKSANQVSVQHYIGMFTGYYQTISHPVQLTRLSVGNSWAHIQVFVSESAELNEQVHHLESTFNMPCSISGDKERGYHLTTSVPMASTQQDFIDLSQVKMALQDYAAGDFFEYSGSQYGLYTAIEEVQILPLLTKLWADGFLSAYSILFSRSAQGQFIVELSSTVKRRT